MGATVKALRLLALIFIVFTASVFFIYCIYPCLAMAQDNDKEMFKEAFRPTVHQEIALKTQKPSEEPVVKNLPIAPIPADNRPVNTPPEAYKKNPPVISPAGNFGIETTSKNAQKEDKISLDLKGIDILELFRILSLKMGISIVPSKNVSGRVNIYLNNVSLDDALDVIVISQDLAAERKGNIINIMTAADYEKSYGKKYNEKRIIKSARLKYAKPSTVFNVLSQIKSDIGKVIMDEATGTVIMIDIPSKVELMTGTIEELDQPLQTEIFDIKYSKPSDMKTHLSTMITTGPGEVFIDERSSKMVVSDLPDKMEKIRHIMKAFDTAPREVFIEAEMLELTLDKKFEQGIEWDKIFSDEQWLKWLKAAGLTLVGEFPISTLTSIYGKMTIGTLNQTGYAAVIKFLQTYGDTKILSRPRIAVINNQEARILVGRREAYITASQSQGQTLTVTAENVQFIDVGVKLNVVPTINTDGYVTMKIKPEISSVASTLTTTAGTKVPIISTSEAETIVRVKDGTMIMIAGLMKEERTESIKGIPVLSKLPVIGAIFRNNSTETKKTELIVFITPYIITGDAMLPGTEPEKLVPPDMVHEDLKDAVIYRRVKEIGQKGLGEKETTRTGRAPFESEKPTVDFEDKMKGMKKF